MGGALQTAAGEREREREKRGQRACVHVSVDVRGNSLNVCTRRCTGCSQVMLENEQSSELPRPQLRLRLRWRGTSLTAVPGTSSRRVADRERLDGTAVHARKKSRSGRMHAVRESEGAAASLLRCSAMRWEGRLNRFQSCRLKESLQAWASSVQRGRRHPARDVRGSGLRFANRCVMPAYVCVTC